MIKNISIKNFQSHKKTEFDLVDGVNVIIGPSDSGKSAIIRALNWVINNKPSGDFFRSNWGGDTSIAIQIDKKIIERIKTKKENAYNYFSNKNTKANEDNCCQYKAMGAGVPEDIQDALNFSELNIQYQMDSPFLLSESPGEVARQLNRIVKLDVIDSTLKKLESQKRKGIHNIEHFGIALTTHKLELEKIPDIDYIESDIRVLECLEEDICNLDDSIKVLTNLIYDYKDITGELVDYTDLDSFENEINKLKDLIDEIYGKNISFENLFDLLEEISNIRKELQNINSNDKLEKEISILLSTNDQVIELDRMTVSLRVLMSEISAIEEQIDLLGDDICDTENKFNSLMPDVCPLCDQEI
jgi:exonuclease SbcC